MCMCLCVATNDKNKTNLKQNAKKKQGIMEVMILLAQNVAEDIEKISFLVLDIFYHFFRLENAKAMCNIVVETNEPLNPDGTPGKVSYKMHSFFFLIFVFFLF